MLKDSWRSSLALNPDISHRVVSHQSVQSGIYILYESPSAGDSSKIFTAVLQIWPSLEKITPVKNDLEGHYCENECLRI